MQLKDVIQKTTQFFRDKGFDSPRLDTELLLAKALNWDRLKLYLNYEYPLSEKELSDARELVRRRVSGEPVAYILGHKDFYNHNFVVTRAVLIPRPETESITHEVIEWWRSLVDPRVHVAAEPEAQDASASEPQEDPVESQAGEPADDSDANNEDVPSDAPQAAGHEDSTVGQERPVLRVVDLGTGSGCIGLSILAEIPDARLLAVDISGEALEVARLNAERLGVSERVSFLNTDAAAVDLKEVMTALGGVADAVVANPPYIAENDPEVQPQVKAFEPASALFSADEGLAHIRAWSQTAAKISRPGALVMFEMGYKQGPQARAVFEASGAYETIEVVKDLGGLERFIRAVRNERS